MKTNIVADKSLCFWIAISKYSLLLNEKRYYGVSSQLFRSWTSIWANIRESIGAQSSKDFLHKLQIALKESYETDYWFEILEKWFNEDVSMYKDDLREIIKLLVASIKTIKSK